MPSRQSKLCEGRRITDDSRSTSARIVAETLRVKFNKRNLLAMMA
jgi:hypothetical protein